MDYKQVNDYEVMYMVRENEDGAKDLLFKKYRPLIGKLASKYSEFAKRHGVEFDDLVQEGYIALNQAICNYDENSGILFYSYASLCINRHLITYCRNMNSKKNYILDNSLSDEVLYENAPDFANPEQIVFSKLAYQQFVHIKCLFDINYSSIFELRYNGFSYKEISALLDIPISTIDGRIYRIKNKIKEEKLFS